MMDVYDLAADRVRWEWCYLCRHAVIRCPHCNNQSCNGSGCSLCYYEFEEANKLVNNIRDLRDKALFDEWRVDA